MKIFDSIQVHAAVAVEIGDQVTVDGLQGRGMVKAVKDGRVTVEYRNGLTVERDARFVHVISNRTGA